MFCLYFLLMFCMFLLIKTCFIMLFLGASNVSSLLNSPTPDLNFVMLVCL